MFTNCNAVTIYHPEGAVNHRPVFCRHVIQNDSIYVCIPASSVTDYVPARDDLLFRGIISEEKELHEIQTLPNKHTITAVADCRYGSAAVQHIEVTAN